MKNIVRMISVLPLALVPSLVWAQEAETSLGIKVVIATLPVILGAIVLYYLLHTKKD